MRARSHLLPLVSLPARSAGFQRDLRSHPTRGNHARYRRSRAPLRSRACDTARQPAVERDRPRTSRAARSARGTARASCRGRAGRGAVAEAVRSRLQWVGLKGVARSGGVATFPRANFGSEREAARRGASRQPTTAAKRGASSKTLRVFGIQRELRSRATASEVVRASPGLSGCRCCAARRWTTSVLRFRYTDAASDGDGRALRGCGGEPASHRRLEYWLRLRIAELDVGRVGTNTNGFCACAG